MTPSHSPAGAQVLQRADAWARHQAHAYRRDTDEARPLGGYTSALAVYGSGVAALAAAVRLQRKRVPREIRPWDVALLGLATHKLSRTLAKDAVTSPLRAPFTEYEGAAGDAEVMEESREHGGPRHALAELLTCPFCLAQWVATAFVGGSVFAPRFTRLAEATMAGVAVSDFLQLAYAAMQKLSR